MSELVIQVGNVIVDNDQREMTAPGQHRRGKVEDVWPQALVVRWNHTGRTTKIARSRVVSGEAPPTRRTGYTLIG